MALPKESSLCRQLEAKIRSGIREEVGHWIWQGAVNRGLPKTTLQINGKQKWFSVRRAAYELSGQPLKARDKVRNNCGLLECVSPAHTQIIVPRPTTREYSPQGRTCDAPYGLVVWVQSLRSKGFTYTQIENRTGVKPGTAQYWCTRMKSGFDKQKTRNMDLEQAIADGDPERIEMAKYRAKNGRDV